jgi:hypothetical protein
MVYVYPQNSYRIMLYNKFAWWHNSSIAKPSLKSMSELSHCYHIN